MVDDNTGKQNKSDLERYILYFEGVPAGKVMAPDVIDECKKGLGVPGVLIITYSAEPSKDTAIVLAISVEGEKNGVLIGYGDAKKEAGEAMIRVLGGRLVEVSE